MVLKNNISTIILFATLIRCIVALSVSLGNDEIYYLTYARHLQWNYFDHPPLVALLIRVTTFNLTYTSDFFIRLGPIILSAVNTFLMYLIGNKIKNQQAGLVAALLYSSSIYSSIIAGLFIMPDAPQLFFWILSLYFLTVVVKEGSSSKIVNQSLLWFGATAGLCVMSKVHGVFLWLGFGLYIIVYDRKLFSKPFLYLSALLTLIIISPILLWNIENDFITYTFHSNRIVINQGVNFNSFMRECLGGFLYNNPMNYGLIFLGLFAFFKNKVSLSLNYTRLFLLMSLPLIILLLGLSFFRDTLPHWSGPGYTALILLVACFLVDIKTNSRLVNLVWIANILIVLVCFFGLLFVNFYPGTLGSNKEINLGQGDVTLDLYDWNYFKKEVKRVCYWDNKSGKTSTNFIVNNKWFPAAHIDNYIVQPLGMNFVAIGELNDIHTYFWINQQRKVLKPGDDAYFITISNSFKDPNLIYGKLFAEIHSPVVICQFRSGKPVRNMLVYLMKDFNPEALK
ncbi:glycosyltransferase family 39 protein [Flavobacterium ovatum]|uniref:ArnT family glycosyltransferase n=1 Tax=Flavobacterium ovatum TaxID=1928857 RepID=UPI00344DD010